jgi:hypothetical protein
MRPRHTRRTDASLNGPSIQRSLRLPEAQVKLVQRAIDNGIPEIHTLTDAATDALWLWLYETKALEMNGHTPEPALAARPKFSDVDLDALDEEEEDGI